MPAIAIFPQVDLANEDRGWTRGYAHLSFDDVPRHARGWLDLGPVPLAAVQEIDPGAGYPLHHHEHIQTITLMLDGALLHEDSLGNRHRIGAGQLALLSAGAGIEHAELTDATTRARAVLFWLRQRVPGGAPAFAVAPLPTQPTHGFVPLASGRGDAGAGALQLRNDVALHHAVLAAADEARFVLGVGRRAYVVAPDADVELDGLCLAAGGRALVDGPGPITMRARGRTTVTLLDLPCLQPRSL
jgi:redox-sensitive bicupin YhaK (pirin superfamily)